MTTELKQSNFEITKDLQETVRKNTNIKNVHFDEEGRHYFNKHTINVHTVDDKGYSTKVEEVQALPGAKKSLIKITLANKTVRDAIVNTAYTPIAATFTRDEILAANAVERSMSEQEKMEIVAKMVQISKSGDFQKLMDKINASKI